MPAGGPVVTWELARDDEARERAGAVVISWSGLAYADCRVLDSARGSSITRAFLDAAAAWLDLEPPIRWMSLATGITLALAPYDVPGAMLSLVPAWATQAPIPPSIPSVTWFGLSVVGVCAPSQMPLR